MTVPKPHTATLLIDCADQRGIVCAVTDFIARNQGNVIDLEQHVDCEDQHFFMRVEWDLDQFQIDNDQIAEAFDQQVGQRFGMQRQLAFSSHTPRMALFVSQHGHCLFDILSRHHAGEWDVEIPLIISNHSIFESVAENAGIDFYLMPVSAETKKQQEEKQLQLLHQYQIDFIVLARYMQILSPEFIRQYENRIINIHHSFLPAFPGARPYHSAHERGVKIIGATSHYVTAELDAGPIIEQDIVRVRHTDSIDDLKRKGQDNEKVVLSRAIRRQLRHQILVYKNRCVVFG